MKAKYIAVVLSFFIAAFPTHANNSKQDTDQKQLAAIVHKIDLNKADLQTLTGSIKGVGKKRAQAIIAYRESHHGFKSVDELSEVKGLGQRFVNVNRDKLNQVFVVSKIE